MQSYTKISFIEKDAKFLNWSQKQAHFEFIHSKIIIIAVKSFKIHLQIFDKDHIQNLINR